MISRHLRHSRHFAKVLCRVEEDFHQVPQIRVRIAPYESKRGVRVEGVELGKVVQGFAIFAKDGGFRS